MFEAAMKENHYIVTNHLVNGDSEPFDSFSVAHKFYEEECEKLKDHPKTDKPKVTLSRVTVGLGIKVLSNHY